MYRTRCSRTFVVKFGRSLGIPASNGPAPDGTGTDVLASNLQKQFSSLCGCFRSDDDEYSRSFDTGFRSADQVIVVAVPPAEDDSACLVDALNRRLARFHITASRLSGKSVPSSATSAAPLQQQAPAAAAAAAPTTKNVQRMAQREPGYAMLYHQTDRAAADSILRSQMFRMGSTGFAGAGIYFAMNPDDTEGKALHKGVTLEAKVFIGQSLNISDSDKGLTLAKIKARGNYDSVLILGMRTGIECVIYDHAQIKDIREYKP